jgi:hypothetical protein
MYKRFLRKEIRENSYPRCHFTKKRGKWKPKIPYNSKQSAILFLEERELEGYEVYKCPVCCKWHIGYHKRKE